MNRNEIITGLAKAPCNGTLLNFPDRGPWGSNKYRGNCSGWIHAFLLAQYKPKKMAELFAGSGTGSDVCKDYGIPYIGADLNPNPVRGNILVCNAITDDVPDAFYTADMLFMHPPYSEMIRIPYAGFMYKDPTGELSKSDLGQMPWKEFIDTLNKVVMKYYAAMPRGGRMSILMGDVKRQGKLYSMLADIVKPGSLEQILIKGQHNCVSDARSYTGRGFVPIQHEYLLVTRKDDGYIIAFSLPKSYATDIRDSKTATWKDVVYAAMQRLGGSCNRLDTLYEEIGSYKKAKEATLDWKAQVRKILQISGLFTSDARGAWSLAAA